MKALLSLIVTLSFAVVSFAQNVAINSDGSAPDASAMLDVKSTSKGFLAPRMTAAQRNEIVSPTTGLTVYQTDGNAGFYYYNGSTWTQIGDASGATQWTTTGSDIYYNAGNVGIGTTTPNYKLDVNGNIKASQFKVDETGYFQTQLIDGSTEDVVIGCDPNDFLFYERENNFYQFNIGGNPKLRIQENGRVGIGTMAPDAPLHVNGAVGISTAASYFHSGTSNTLIWDNPGNFNVTIRASNDIMAGGAIVATSDKRVKENITELHNSLDLIGKLRPVSYNKIDRVSYGDRLNYGFIAQEVEEVIPNAVNTGTGEIPVLKPFEKVEFEDGVSYTILVKNGDNIVEQKYTTKDPKPVGEIIVKSKSVNDLKSITYDMIFTVAVDAIQEQQAIVESQQKQIDALQQQLSKLTELVEALQK